VDALAANGRPEDDIGPFIPEEAWSEMVFPHGLRW